MNGLGCIVVEAFARKSMPDGAAVWSDKAGRAVVLMSRGGLLMSLWQVPQGRSCNLADQKL